MGDDEMHQGYHFDDPIIENILVRLPVSSVLRFKSVSKQWYSTLSSSKFAVDHLLNSPFYHPSVVGVAAPVDTLFIKCDKNYYLFSYNDDQISGNFEDNLVKLDVDFGLGNDLNLAGSCNGMICLGHPSHGYLILWNPATGKLRKYESDLESLVTSSPKFWNNARGFGYASSVDDYKYVGIRSVLSGHEEGRYVHIFSLRENKWKEIRMDHDWVVIYGQAVLSNEKLYWSAGRTPGKVIVSFDLITERFDVLDVDDMVDDYFECIGVMGGASIMSETNYRRYASSTSMHIFESSAVVKSMSLPRDLKLECISQMIGFTRTDKFFVTGRWNLEKSKKDLITATLGIVDTRTRPMQYSVLHRFDESVKIARYFPSLVSPFPHGES